MIDELMKYHNVKIYFLSGTGNSYRISTWIKNISNKFNIDARLYPIEKVMDTTTIEDGNDSLIGIIFPTHGFTAPWHILKFTLKLPRRKQTHAFCIATRAGFKFGKVFTPGISGSATFIITLILTIKGYKVRGLKSVDMPSNWFILHPIQGLENQKAIIKRSETNVANFATTILSGNSVWFTLNNIYELIMGTVLFQISIGYLLIGRFFLAKLIFANENCNGCGICERNCFVNAIKLRGRTKKMPFWKYNCESCMRCAALCPKNAIEAGHSWGVILYLISTIPVSIFLFSYLGNFIQWLEFSKSHWFGNIINLVYFYAAIFFSYYIFHALLKIPVVNWLFTHTTFTHFSFWGRYKEPETDLKQITTHNNSVDKV